MRGVDLEKEQEDGDDMEHISPKPEDVHGDQNHEEITRRSTGLVGKGLGLET